MLNYVFRRLLQTLPVFVGIVLICFILLKLTGDPTNQLVKPGASVQQRDLVRARYGLDKPWYVQLGRYLRLDLGVSYKQDRPVSEIIFEGAAVTSRLTLGAIIIAVGLGLFSGILCAAKPHSFWDYASAAGASIGVSIPAFWLAMILILVFSVKLEWLPLPAPEPGKLKYLIIPVVTLGLISTALIARLTRSCLLEAYSQDYVRTARAKGIRSWMALLGHAFPNALVPILTVIGTNLAALLTGAVLTETTCSLPGLGTAINNAIKQQDHPVIMGGCLFFALVFVIVNFVVDLLYGFLDPRIRHHS
ncbi:MAG TPA: ABC transporter permease [Planctomycetota bacterium]|jgi:ABC-type dipeptide/oligopeptide/nickel transport system permease component